MYHLYILSDFRNHGERGNFFLIRKQSQEWILGYGGEWNDIIHYFNTNGGSIALERRKRAKQKIRETGWRGERGLGKEGWVSGSGHTQSSQSKDQISPSRGVQSKQNCHGQTCFAGTFLYSNLFLLLKKNPRPWPHLLSFL